MENCKNFMHNWVKDTETGEIGVQAASSRGAVIHFCNTSIVTSNSNKRYELIQETKVPANIYKQLNWLCQQ